MKIPLNEIVYQVGRPSTVNRTGNNRITRTNRKPVVLKTPRGYKLLLGEQIIREKKNNGAKEVECSVKESLTDQEKWELSLAEQYYSALISPMELGKSFVRYREANNITQQELARRTGITPGTIHHYESLIKTLDPNLAEKLESGVLTFKEARCIADIDSHERQREIAQPFLDGRLSSVHVERIVGIAKSNRNMSVDDIINARNPNEKKNSNSADTVFSVQPPEAVQIADPDLVESSILRIAGELDALRLQHIPGYRRLKLISSLRILDSRLKSTLHHLNVKNSFVSKNSRTIDQNNKKVEA